MAGLSLMCGDCGSQLRSVEEAQEHAELTGHTDFSESTEAVLNLICATCGKPCRSRTESDLHTKRTGHTEFTDKTIEAAKPIDLEVKKDPSSSSSLTVVGEDTPMSEGTDMVVAEVNKELLAELESMDFPTGRATRALHFSGNTSIEAAINWVVEHENDPDIDELPMVSSNAKDEAAKAILTPEEIKSRAQELRERARKKKEEEEKRMEREREKERIRVGKEILEAKRIEEDNERKRILALRKAEKEEEKRAREKIRQRLEEDKAERRRKLGLPPEDPNKVKTVTPAVEEKKVSLPVRPATQAEQMRDQLRSLKHNHKILEDVISALLVEKRTATGDSRENIQVIHALYSKNYMGKRMYGKNETECFYCKNAGHIAINCKIHANDLLKGKIKESANIVVHAESLDVVSDDDTIENEDRFILKKSML